MAHLTNFSFEFFYKIFTEDVSLPLLYYRARKSKMTKNSNQGGPALNTSVAHQILMCQSFEEHFVPMTMNLESGELLHRISSRIAGPDEFFSSDFRACARSPCGVTHCSFSSVSCSCDAAPRTVVRKRALPVASSPLSEQQGG